MSIATELPMTESECDSLVDRWHAGEGDGKPLHEFMGLTEEQYAAYATLHNVRFAADKPARNTEVVGDYLIDADTGEILEFVGDPTFRITDDASAEWVMEKRLNHTAAIAALEAKRAAILKNIDADIRRHQGRIKALDYRFAAELEAYARQRLAGGKSKTWSCPYGSVAIRKQAERWTWADTPDAKERAVKWAEDHYPYGTAEDVGLVRVKTERIPVLDKILQEVRQFDSEGRIDVVEQTFAFLSHVPERETVTIKTDVKP